MIWGHIITCLDGNNKHVKPYKSNCVFQDVEDLMEWWDTVESKSQIKCVSQFCHEQLTLYDQKYVDILVYSL